MAQRRLKVGIVGLGRMGMRHARNLATRVPEAELVAACSPSAEEREAARALGVPALYPEYGAMLAHPGLEAAYIVTPTSMHADQIIGALDAGKHAFCEKPLALEVEDCLRVEAAAARRPDLVAMIGFVRRFDPSYRGAYERIARGDIGRPFLVRAQTADMHDPSGFFVRFSATSGGILLDMGVHDIDLMRWLLGSPRPLRAMAMGAIALHEGLAATGDHDNAMAMVEFEGGRMGLVYNSRTLAHGHETMTEIVGTRGRISVGTNPRIDRVEIADGHGVRNECTPTFYERFAEAFELEAQSFARAALGLAPPALTLRDATEATRIGVAITRALRSGGVTTI